MYHLTFRYRTRTEVAHSPKAHEGRVAWSLRIAQVCIRESLAGDSAEPLCPSSSRGSRYQGVGPSARTCILPRGGGVEYRRKEVRQARTQNARAAALSGPAPSAPGWRPAREASSELHQPGIQVSHIDPADLRDLPARRFCGVASPGCHRASASSPDGQPSLWRLFDGYTDLLGDDRWVEAHVAVVHEQELQAMGSRLQLDCALGLAASEVERVISGGQ